MSYRNTDKIKTSYRIAYVKPLDAIVIVFSTLCGCKLSDYVPLKPEYIFTLLFKQIKLAAFMFYRF
jgi:hypothetical protein